MRILLRVAVVVALLGAVSACGRVEAKTPAPAPLEAPPPPPRVVVPVVLLPPPEPPPPAASQPSATVAPPPRHDTPPPVTAPAKPPEKPATEPPPAPPPAPPSSDVVELEKKTRQLLNDATRDLDRVIPGNLSPDARAQYDQARRFIAQALDGLKKKYYLYAQGLAEKAANLASQLPKGRLKLVMW